MKTNKGYWRDPKVFSWALYDWANSVFSTTVMAGFFPVFFKQYWSNGIDSNLTTARLGTLISVTSLSIAVVSPWLGALADLRGTKKLFVFLFMILGAASTISLALLEQGEWVAAAALFSVAMFGFTASTIFYDALLSHVASGRAIDRVSSLGYSLGYLGGGVLLALNVWMFSDPHRFGLSSAVEAVQWSFVSVGVWWFVFSLPLMLFVPESRAADPKAKQSLSELAHQTLGQLKSTLQEIRQTPNTWKFLLAFWLYIDGVYTIMTMAVDYGLSIGLSTQHLISALLLVQFIGFPSALVFGYLSTKWGCRVPILICLACYAVTTALASQMATSTHFFMLAVFIGLAQGGVQALSRSLFARMTPPEKSGEYFGLMNLVGKFASILGPVIVGWGAYLSGSPRSGILGLLVLFGLGSWLLWQVKEPEDRLH